MGKVLSSHLGTESWDRRWPWWYYTSPDCGLPIEMQTCAEMASLSLLVFVILSLAPQILFFFLFLLSTVFQRWVILSGDIRGSKFTYVNLAGIVHLQQLCDKLRFSTIFTLSDEVSTVWRDTMEPPLMLTVLCLIEQLLLQYWRGRNLWSSGNPSLWVVGTYSQSWLPLSIGNGGLTGLKVIASFILIKFNGLCNDHVCN